MAGVGISNGIGRFGVSSPANLVAPAGQNRVSNSQEVPWYESGPFWTLVFLVVGYILVFQTLRR
jgi:hypothetical protein